MSNRREVRERVMQALYAHELAGDSPEQYIDGMLRPQFEGDKVSFAFATRLFLRTLEAETETEAIISRHTKNWNFDRIALIDRLVLKMGITEMLSFEDIPPKVSINEAIEVAKKYSTNKSGKFVNGILDAALLELQKEGRLKKSGRGLVGMDKMRANP